MIRPIHLACFAFPILLGSTALQAQAPEQTATFDEASRLMEEKLYGQAAETWKELVAKDPGNANLNWKTGQSYMLSYNAKAKALPFLQTAAAKRVARYGGSGYDPFNPKERNAPVEVDYWLGRAYHLNNEFDRADSSYRKFIAEAGERNDFKNLAARGLEQTANARTQIAEPKEYQVSNIGPMVNSDLPDFSPVISVDGNALFFTSRRIRPDSSNQGILDPIAGLPYENIYVSYKDRNGKWQAPELLNINPPIGHLATVNVSADGQTLITYQDDNGDGNLYESKLVGELWSDPMKMGSDINTKAWETHGALSADGNTFYFVSNRAGGSGGRDIYRVVKLPTGAWSKAQNLGATVNTPYEEDGVFIHPDGRTMYFASTGHNSMGGFDIFSTEQQSDGTWSAPVNIGYPLNTVDDDVFFVTTADGRRGYFSSDKMGGYGEKDIYFVDFPQEMGSEGLAVLKGFIIPPPGEQLSPTTILYVTDKATGEVKSYKPRQRDGVYVAILAPCRNYNLDYRVNDKTVHTEDVYVECESAYQELNKEVYLNPVALAGAASIVDMPEGAPPGSKEQGVPVKDKVTQTQGAEPVAAPKTDAERQQQGEKHVTPDASYAAEFVKYHGYNEKGIDTQAADWKDFVASVLALMDKQATVDITIESSASHVPTRTYGNNDKLSALRKEEASKQLIDAVKAAGKDPANLRLGSVNHLVQGPKYRGDYKDTAKYGKFQYVKLKVR
ncbi:MAG: PD40 domain-containing protein [Flavobacteriales bacterium]|nr:PD40 domain-containing protein [Flavobacteriales bacterium]MBP9079635.1 PD40 domain-containing protein [Flavobacteriales bacterium]